MMAAQKGHRAAQALVTGRAYGGMQPKQQLKINVDTRLLVLAEQYHICAAKGHNGIEAIGDWFADRLIEAIKEKRGLRKEIKECGEDRDDARFAPVFPGFDDLVPGGCEDPLGGFSKD